jgi:long-chain acyl-CoA synthetase
MNTIHGSFRESVRAHPNAVAIKYYQDEQWEQVTYAGLDATVTNTAAGLMEKGVNHESRVAIMSENRPEWIVCYLAAISAGAIAVPIDALLGEDETEHILNHSEADTLICSTHCYEIISRILGNTNALKTIIIFDRSITVRHGQETSGSGREIAENGRNSNSHKHFFSYDEVRDLGAKTAANGDVVMPEKVISDIASILYTSGTTGTSKGVILTHKNFMSNVKATESVLTIGVDDAFILLLPLHHAFPFTICMVIPLTRGSSINFVDILSRDRTRLIKECAPTIMVGVPLLYSKIYRGIMRQVEASTFKRLLFKYGGKKIIGAALKKKLGGRLRIMASGAAPMEPSVIEGFRGLGIEFLEGYGITETSPVVSVNRVGDVKIGSVGPPIDGVEAKIIHPDDEGIGEIVVRGDNVMQGYYRNPEQTAKVIKDGWYHTGDLGWIDDADRLYITGRAKDVIVTRGGKNVHPDVVEAQINKSRYIAESVIIGYKTQGMVGEDVGALIFPDFEVLVEHAGKENIELLEKPDLSDLSEDACEELIERFRELLDNEVKSAMGHLAPYQRVHKTVIEREEFTKTSTRKIKRFLYKGRLDVVDIA